MEEDAVVRQLTNVAVHEGVQSRFIRVIQDLSPDLVPDRCDAILGRQYIASEPGHHRSAAREAVLARSALVG